MRQLLIFSLLVAIIAAGATPGHGQMAEQIIVAGTVVLSVRTPAGGLSIAERAKAIRHRINLALTSEDLTPANFHTQRLTAGMAIRVGRVLIVTVTPDDARANGTTVDLLTRRWLAALRNSMHRAKPMPQPSP